MADSTVTPQKRVLPARQRRESAAKRQAMSPANPTPPATPVAVATPQPTSETRVKRKYTKRAGIGHNLTPARSASTGTSNPEESLPTSMKVSRPLPVTAEAQPEKLSSKQYQSIADSAVLAASLQRSRMQWLCDGVFKKYWTKPVKRKGVIEQPPNNPDVKSMQKLGNATITIEPHTFDVTFFVVRDATMPAAPVPLYRAPIQPSSKPSPGLSTPVPPSALPATDSSGVSGTNMVAPSPSPSMPIVPVQTGGQILSPVPTPTSVSTPLPNPASAPPRVQAANTPPAPANKTTDPVIQMLASRAATDNNLKELMKVVATSRASPEQLKEFQAHIDEINGIVKKQNAESAALKKKAVKTATSTPAPRAPVAAHPVTYNSIHRNSPLNPSPGPSSQFNAYVQPRPEAPVKHVVMEFTSPVTSQAMTSDRWLFPTNAVLDLVYGGTEMTCSFLVEKKGSEVLVSMKDLTSEEMQSMTSKWQAETEYFQPVTMQIKASQHRTIETIARSAKALPEVIKYMEEVMKTKTRAPQEFLIHRLPTEKNEDFTDSAVELSAEDDEALKDTYTM